MEVLLENIAAYLIVVLMISGIVWYYLKSKSSASKKVEAKINKAKEQGFYEPVSLHPVVDSDICIGSGACINACPEKDILGIRNGQATTINASRCVGHGACFHACPVEAISLVMGTEKRGVDLPHVSQEYETNVPGMYIAGELGGMGLIKNAVEQGKQAVDNIVRKKVERNNNEYDLVIVGAGPAGIAASLNAKKHGLKFITIDQETLGGTVFSFPRAKVVMTSPMELPTHGIVKLYETSKTELIDLWKEVLEKNKIVIQESEKVIDIKKSANSFEVITNQSGYKTSHVLLAIGRRGTPRKLGVKGEDKEKVYYKLLDPELIKKKKILVVGGGDSAVESAMLLADEGNHVILSYRSESFKRIKPMNLEKVNAANDSGKLKIMYNTNLVEVKDDTVLLKMSDDSIAEINNDLVYIFAGGELPNKFLEKIGISITTKFGEAVLKHRN
ncbi:MAG: NAD(P)-binding domain-containing protein [Melioribacteraceae bacterium]|nr:NAD(P)-binding domain-containing protein [Melioribacteraceae bacterium]MCF8353458.1 NAD(P)-binding domain-containing protein [Melioribacteraceae bacterium]MCF8393946.1 NAD(P)-binding domain-containing protein [Melioribacteraceae bacterium]MCF8419019.1 NAD(P)-binding domain-containing protein [Melioribacteraceae bacterium]